jgi:hypothetical protein
MTKNDRVSPISRHSAPTFAGSFCQFDCSASDMVFGHPTHRAYLGYPTNAVGCDATIYLRKRTCDGPIGIVITFAHKLQHFFQYGHYVGDIEREAKSATLRTMNDLSTLSKIPLGSLTAQAEALLNSKQRDEKAPSTGKGKSSTTSVVHRFEEKYCSAEFSITCRRTLQALH